MFLTMTCIVLFVVGGLMAIKPMTYWQIGHMMHKDAEAPGEMYLRMIRISGVIVILIAGVLTAIGMLPDVTGKTVEVSGGDNWEYSFSADEGMAELKHIGAVENANPYELVFDGENIYFLGREVENGSETGRVGVYSMPAAENFAGEAELLAQLNEKTGEYENLQHEKGRLIWLQQSIETECTAVYVLDLKAGGEPVLHCTLLEPMEECIYHDGQLYWTDGDAAKSSLLYWDGEEAWKLVGKTHRSRFGLHMEDGWIGTPTDKRASISRVNLDNEDEMKLELKLKGADGIWTSDRYTLMSVLGGQAAVIVHEGKDAYQYVLKDIGDYGLMDMAGDRIWQMNDNVLTVYNMENMTFCELNVPADGVTAMDVSEDGSVMLYDSEKNLVYFSEFSD
ncbi:MAG: hypothetical protein IKV72_05690 [Firmicutes bacterium]|nr:hypothetical protein [Bacillota bacterium]MBR5489178.1 hypothetical protein [Bacillota bacterium]